jgi:hypothetical protein
MTLLPRARRDVHAHFIKPATDALCCRFVELREWATGADADGRPFVGQADYFVSHSWDSPWEEVMAAIEAHSERQDALTYYWVDIFAVCQHWKTDTASRGQRGCMPESCGLGCPGCAKVGDDMHDWETADPADPKGFERVIRSTGKTLLVMEPWHSPRVPTRVWCLYEIYSTLTANPHYAGGTVEVALGLGRTVALHHHSATLYQIFIYTSSNINIRCLCF